MEQKYGQTAPPKKSRTPGMPELFDDNSPGYYSPTYPSYKTGPISPSAGANYNDNNIEFYKSQFNQPYPEDYYRPRESRPRRADQFAKQQAGRHAQSNFLHHESNTYPYYEGSPGGSRGEYEERYKPTYVQAHRVHRGIPSNFGGSYGVGSGLEQMNFPLQNNNTSPPPIAGNKQSRSPVRPIPVPPQGIQQHSMAIGSPVRPSSPLQGVVRPPIPVNSPPRNSQSPVRPIPVPPQNDIEEEQDNDNFRVSAPLQVSQQPAGYQMFGRMPSPNRESTNGQYFSVYGAPAQKEVSSSRNSPKLAEYKKYYSPTQKVRNDGYSKLYERVFHLKPEDKPSK